MSACADIIVGLCLHLNKLGNSKWRYLLFPFKGGNRHIVFQLLSWLLWGFSALTILPVSLSMLPGYYMLPKDLPTIPRTHVDVVSGAAAVVAFIGELFMIKAVLVYDRISGAAAAGAQVYLDRRRLQVKLCSSCSTTSPSAEPLLGSRPADAAEYSQVISVISMC
eukprot:gene12851-12978_t